MSLLSFQVVFDRAHHVDAIGHQRRAPRARDSIDRRLNRGRIIGAAVTRRTLVLDVHDEVGDRRRRAILRRARAPLHRQESERERDCPGRKFRQARSQILIAVTLVLAQTELTISNETYLSGTMRRFGGTSGAAQISHWPLGSPQTRRRTVPWKREKSTTTRG